MNDILIKIKHEIIALGFYALRILPVNNNKIVISSFDGKGYGSEGRAIYEELQRRRTQFDVVWLCEDLNSFFPKGIRPVKHNSFKSMIELVTAKIWIDNRRKNIFVRKRKNQVYFQTWHGNVCIKYVEKDAVTLPKSYFEKAKADSKMADFFVSGSKWRDNNYRSAFWYDGEIIHGDLYNTKKYIEDKDEIKKQVCEYFNIDYNSKILLYAPTFRQDSRLDCYNLDYKRLITVLKNRFDGDWVIIIRLHPNISKLNESLVYSDDVINGTNYSQVYDLISACDVLVSDFSGVIFDGFRFKKMVLLYASDIDRYVKEERGMYFDFKKLPAPLSTNNDEIEKNIMQFDEFKYALDRDTFVDELGYYDNNASVIIADNIEKAIGGEIK